MKAEEFIEDVLSNGYKEYKHPIGSADRYFQKRYIDFFGTKYFINIEFYDKIYFDNGTNNESFEVDLQFNKIFKGKEITINTTIFSLSDWNYNNTDYYNLEFIEEFVEDYFVNNDFEYYELN